MHNENQSSEKFFTLRSIWEVSSEHGVASSYEYSGGVSVPNDDKGKLAYQTSARGSWRGDACGFAGGAGGSSEQFTRTI